MVAESLVLVVAADGAIAETLSSILRRLGCKVVTVTRVVDALAELHGVDFDVTFVSRSFTLRSAVDVLRAASELSPDTDAIVILDPGQVDVPVEYVRQGAFDFLRQPLLAEEVASVLERASSRRQLRSATTLFRASHAILTNTAAEEIPRITVDLAAELLSADGVAFYQRRDRSGELELLHARGFSNRADAAELLALSSAIAREAPSSTPRLLPEDATGAAPFVGRIRSAIVCPIVIEGRVFGVLAMLRSTDPRPFRRRDAERSGVFATQLRLALDNVRLVARTVASERLAAIGELAAGVAHEINNPLTYVLSNCELALETIDDLGPSVGSLRGMLEDVQEGAERIRDIARDLRLLARNSVRPVGTPTPHPRAEIFDLGDAVGAALRVTRATVHDWIEVHLDLTPGMFVSGSRGRISQIFVNLLVNAAQAVEAAPARVRVEIATARVDGRIVATVTDHGPGIPPDVLHRIFEAFFTTKTGDQGTGLGLSITRAIVEDHGGALTVSSEVGKGTRFTVDFPAAAEPVRSLRARRDSRMSVTPPSS